MGRTPEFIFRILVASGTAVATAAVIPSIRGTQENSAGDYCIPGQKVFEIEVNTGDMLRNAMVHGHEVIFANPAYGGYLELGVDGKTGSIVDCPQAVAVEFRAQFSTTSIYRGDGTIPIFRNPSMSSTKSHQIRSQEILTRSAVPVFGRKIPEHPIITVEHEGTSYEGSVWAMLVGREPVVPIFPTSGRVLQPKEGAYYVPGSFLAMAVDKSSR